MNFIHTFCSTPLLKHKFNYQAGYSNRLEAILVDYTYSALCVKNILKQRIILYADETGAEILNHIPYDEVIVLKNFDADIHFAASIKFEAIKNMTVDDVLIDGDLFLQKESCMNAIKEKNGFDFVYSFFEPWEFVMRAGDEGEFNYSVKFYDFLVSTLAKRIELFTPPYSLPEKVEDICWQNTSFMKFNNLKLRDEYLKQYMKFKEGLKGLDFKNTWPDVIIEQYHMKKLLEYGKYTSAPMIPDFPTQESNKYALGLGFTHLGGAKHRFTKMFKKSIEEKFGQEVLEAVVKKQKEWEQTD